MLSKEYSCSQKLKFKEETINSHKSLNYCKFVIQLFSAVFKTKGHPLAQYIPEDKFKSIQMSHHIKTVK